MRRILCVAMFCVAVNASAEEPDRLETLTVKVSAETPEQNLPLAVSVVDTDELASPDQQSLQDYLVSVPGLFALNQDNAAQGLRVSIRGFGARAAFGVRGIRVQLDGVPLTLPDGQTDLDALDLALLESAQVVRGPSAALFGNAAGGAILLSSRRPSIEPEASVETLVGSFGQHRLRLQASGRGMLGSYLATDIDGFRAHASSESDLVNARLDQALGEGRITASISSLDITAEDPGGLTQAQAGANRKAARPQNLQFNAGETIEQQRLALGWQGVLGDWSLQSTGYAGQREFDNRLPFTGGGQVQFDRGFGGLGLVASRRMGQHRISLGLDAQTQSDDRQRFDNNDGQRGALSLDQLEKARSAGLFLRDTVTISNDWEASLGIRRDRLRLTVDDRFLSDGDDSGARSIGDWSFDASLAHWLGSQMLYARVATSYETPTNSELANPDGGGFNTALSSTDAVNYEFGTKGRWRTVTYSVALYAIEVEDELLPFELAGQPGRSFFRNAGETQRRGIELTARVPLAPHWRVAGSLSYASNEFKGGSLDGNSLPGMPEDTAWLSLQYEKGAFDTALTAIHIGRLFADDANSAAVASYQLLNLQTSWRFASRWTLQTGIDNLLGEDYNDNIRINAFGGRYFEPAAGRSYRASLRLGLG